MTEVEIHSPVVLLCGISGSGKTTVARRLANAGFRHLSADNLAWAQHGASLSSMSVERQREVFVQAHRELLIALERALTQNQKVVVDSTLCSREKRDAIRRLCRSFGLEPMLIYLRAKPEVLSRRLASRTGAGPHDQIVPDSCLRIFCSTFEAPDPDENPLILDQL